MASSKLVQRRYTLAQLEYFVDVAELGSMTLAAQRLNVTQAAVSLAIAGLERELGLRLFHRRRARGLALTARGREVLLEARRVTGSAAEFDRLVVSQDPRVHGSLTVGCFAPLAPILLPATLGALREQHPALEVRFEEGSLLSVQEAILRGAAEVALSYDHEIRSGIATLALSTASPMQVVLARDHRLAGRVTVTVADLAEERLIVMSVAPSRLYLQRLLGDAGLADRVAYTAGTYELAFALAARGLGVALVGFATGSPLSIEGLPLTSVRLDEPSLATSVVLLSPAGVELSRKAQIFADAARRAAEAVRHGQGRAADAALS